MPKVTVDGIVEIGPGSRGRVMRAGVILFASFVVSVAALAAAEPAVRPRPAPTPAPTAEQRRMIGEFARCLAEKHRAEAVEIVLNKVAWDKPQLPSSRAKRDCPAPQAISSKPRPLRRTEQDTLLFSLAEALVREEFPTFDQNVVITAQPLPASTLVDELWPLDHSKKYPPEQLERLQAVRDRITSIMAPQILGECVVRSNPEAAHRLVMTLPDSAEERSALAALAPTFNDCAMAGSQFTTTRHFMRGILALSYYRIAHAPRAQPSGAQR